MSYSAMLELLGRSPKSITHCGLRVGHAVEDGAGVDKERRPGFRKHHATRRPFEKNRPELVFEMADLAAYGGLRDS